MMTARKLLFLSLSIATVAGATAYRGFLELFSVATPYDDTGFMLSLIKGFNERGHLYQETFSQYGPFYSEFYYVVCGLLGVPVTHDGIRWVVLVFWIFGSIAGAIFAFRLTGRIWIALLAQLFCFHALKSLVGEPGHPLSLIVGCFGVLALCLASHKSEQSKLWRPLAIGALLGVLLMIKINIGIFALAAVGTAVIYRAPLDNWGKVLRGAAAILFAAPLLLIRTGWPVEVRTCFAILFLCTLLSVLISYRGQTFEWRATIRFGLCILTAMLLTCALCLLGALLAGSGWTDLLNGMITEPMRLGTIFTVLPPIGRLTAISAVIGLLLAIAWRFSDRLSPVRRSWLLFGMRLFFLALVILWLATSIPYFTCVLPFLWIAVIPVRSDAQEPDRTTGQFARLAIVLLAVGQVLGLYPVSGTQVSLPIYLGTLCVLFVVAGLLADLKVSSANLSTLRRVSVTAAIIGLAIGVLGLSWRVYRLAASRYDHFTALTLPGAKLLRTDESTAATYRFLAENLRECRPSFLTLPGLNSLYGWSGRDAPTGFNTTVNCALLSPAQQRAMVDVGRTCQPIAVVLNRQVLNFWVRGKFQPSGPLIDFVTKECRPVGRVKNYELLVLRDSPPPKFTYCVTLDKEWRSDAAANQITAFLPANIGTVTSATLLQASAERATRHRLEAAIASDGLEKVNAAPGSEPRQFSIHLQDTRLISRASLDQTLVQLKDDSGQTVNLPFLRPPARRPAE